MSPKILIVDDVPLNVAMLEHVLQAEGFHTVSAGDGAMAVAISRTERPDLILLDILMPDENGFETCARLKSDPLTMDIPVIFLSALDDVKNRVKALKVGGVDYVSKPVHGEEVLARVRVQLRIRDNCRRAAQENQDRLEESRAARETGLVQPADCPESSFAVYYKPAQPPGGDFYDVVAVDCEVFGYFVAEVSGTGASGAFLASSGKALLRQYSGPLFSPEDTMRGVDAGLRQQLGKEQHPTACYALLNRRTGSLAVVSAGHPPVIVVGASGDVRTLEMDRNPPGMFSSLVLQHKEIHVSAGDRFYLYTDGLIESPGERGRGGIEHLVESCVRHRSDSLAETVWEIGRDIESRGSVNDLLLLGIAVSP